MHGIQFHNQPLIGYVKFLAQDYNFVSNRMENRSVSINWRRCDRRALLSWEGTHPLPLPWIPQDNNLIYRLVRTIGMKWTKINEALGNRTLLQVKTRWYSVLRRRELSLMDNLGEILDIRSRMHRNEFIKEIARD
jgi:hypothetical protein